MARHLRPARDVTRPALFPSFFMGGFECSTHIDRTRQRRDYVALTQHDRHVREDYARLRACGLEVVREGLRWHLCDRDGGASYDFSSIAPMVDAAQEAGLTQINCLFHYGYPDDMHPLDGTFVERFSAFARAFARWRASHVSGPRWYGVVNEPSMFAFAAGEAGWFAPLLSGEGDRVKRTLVRASLEATRAIQAEDAEARLLNIDPSLHEVAPRTAPDLEEEASRANEAQYEARDMVLGRVSPELGGWEESFEVVGVNCYPDTQHEVGSDGQLALNDPRRQPLRETLRLLWERYSRPIMLAETSARGDERPVWLRYVVDEVLAALQMGIDVQGICLYPVVDMREWAGGRLGEWGHLGLFDTRWSGDMLERVPNPAYLEALRQAQARVAASGLAPVWARETSPPTSPRPA